MSRPSTSAPVWDIGRLRIATDAAGVALWSWDVDTDEMALDARAHCLWGVEATSTLVTFEKLSERIHPQDLDRVRAAFTAARGIDGAYEIDFRISHDEALRWISARGRGDDQGIIGRTMFGVFLDVTDRKLAEEARELLANEMSHRVKNLFAIAAALTDIAARSADTPKEMATDLTRRLVALGNAHELVRPTLSDQQKATNLADLLSVLLGAYDDRGAIGDRIRVAVPGVLVGEGEFVGLLELPENFRLADDHRIEAAGDLEKMMQAVRFGERVKFIAERAFEGVLRDEKFFQGRKRRFGRERRGGVNFHAVARRENRRLGGDAGVAQCLERGGNFFAGKRKTLAQFQRRRAMAQADDDDAHG